MRTINKRILIIIIIALVFFAFTDVLLFSMLRNAPVYAMNTANNHIFKNGVLTNAGAIYDVRGRKIAYSEGGTRRYSDDTDTRKALLHIIGDSDGFMTGGLQNTFRPELCGYDLVRGVNVDDEISLNLTLDSELCTYAFTALGNYRGCAAVCNYRTGELRAIATSASYDPYYKPSSRDIEEKSIYDGVYINRFFNGLYTPGSIFKIVTAEAALSDIEDIYDQSFYCEGEYTENGNNIICMGEHYDLGFRRAMNVSCNVAFAQIAEEVGEKELKRVFVKNGLDTKYKTTDRITTTGGQFSTEAARDLNSLGWTGIGQSNTLINPYSFLTYICAIANGGKTTMPYFVKNAFKGDTLTYSAKPLDSGIEIDPSVASGLRDLLRSNVRDYYGDDMFGYVTMCGKTGTAQQDEGESTSLFVGFSADEEFPYAIIVIMEEAGGGLRYAGATGADIMSHLYNRE